MRKPIKRNCFERSSERSSRPLRVLVACEESQTVCKAFRDLGHEAYSCDIVECSGGHPEWHIRADVTPLIYGFCRFITSDGQFHFIDDRWDLVIAHPPCTYISAAGARHMYPRAGCLDEERLKKAIAARHFFMLFNNLNTHVCIENPVPLSVVGLPPYDQKIQPYEFGEPYSKATCLWLKDLPPLKPTVVLSEHEPWCPSNCSRHAKGYKGSKGVAQSSKLRAKTFRGIAEAMAVQWSDFLRGVDYAE